VLAFSAVNLAYAAIVIRLAAAGRLSEAVPASIARRLVVDGLDLTSPLVLGYNLAIALAPLALFLIRDFRALCCEASADGAERLEHVIPLLAAGSLLMVAAYLVVWPDALLPFAQERVRWFTDQIPDAIAVDQPLLVRAQYLLRLVADIRWTLPLLNALFPVALLWGLAAFFGGGPAVAATLVVFLGWGPLYNSSGADGEVPAATFALLGLLAVLRGRVRIGAFFLWFALLWKATALYYVVTAAGFLLSRRNQGESWHVLRSPAVIAMGGFLLLYYANYAVLLGRRGVGYLVHEAAQPFFVYPLVRFGADLFTVYLAATALALAGLLLGSLRMRALLYVTVALLALRCTARVAGGYYTLFFAPLLACLVAALFARLLEMERPTRRAVVAALIIGALAVNAAGFARASEQGLSRRTLGWDPLIRQLAEDLPRGAQVLYRKVSPRYDLIRIGRDDLRFAYLPEDQESTLALLESPGPKAYLAPASDLDGDANRRLAESGFRVLRAPFGPPDQRFVALVRPGARSSAGRPDPQPAETVLQVAETTGAELPCVLLAWRRPLPGLAGLAEAAHGEARAVAEQDAAGQLGVGSGDHRM
jgi:hypothetical protein